MRKNWYNRLLLSYLPVFFIISLSLLLMTYLTLSEISKRASIKANQALTSNVTKLIDNQLEAAEAQLLYEIRNNEKFQRFFAAKPRQQNSYIDIQAATSLKEFLQNNPLFEAVYLYRVPDTMVLTPKTLVPLNQFVDKEYIGLVFNSRSAYQWTVREIAGDHNLEVISLAKNTHLKNMSLLVGNIRTSQLQAWISSMVDSDTTYVHLKDSAGNIIVSTEKVTRNESGKVVSKGKVLSTSTSEQTGWVVTSGNRNGGILEFVSSLFYLWMALATIIVVLGVAWIIHVSRRHYKPLQALTSLVSRADKNRHVEGKHRDGDEFKLIEETIEELLDESSVWQEQHRELTIHQKRHLFLSLMENVQHTGNFGRYLEKELANLGIEKHITGSLVAVVEIDAYTEFLNQYHSDQHLFKYILGDAMKELVENKPYTVWTEWVSKSKMGVLFLFHNGEGEEEVIACCDQLRDWVANNLDFTITIGVGSVAQRLDATTESFREAVTAISYKFSLGNNRLILTNQIAAGPKGELFKQLQYAKAISTAFRQADSKWEEYYLEMLQMLDGSFHTRNDVVSMMQVLVGYMNKEMEQAPEEVQRLWTDQTQEKLPLALEEETREQLISAVDQVLQQAFTQINGLRENKSTHTVLQQIKQYIEDHYSDVELSLTMLSERYEISPKYLSRMFHETFGMKFIEFVTQVRMEKAERLLNQSDDAIQDIGRAVGYDQSLTFIRVFKKHTGETPGQYRKRVQGEEK